MPRTIMILRHAKSSWSHGDLPDIDRPLRKRGKRDARRIGQELRARGLAPQVVLTSPARRARATTKRVLQACQCAASVENVSALYPGDSWALWHTLSDLPDEWRTVLIVGHNPGLDDLVTALLGRPVHLATATLAVIEMPVDAWADLADLSDPVPARLRLWLSPRDLPPA